jgi:hypothetical protein
VPYLKFSRDKRGYENFYLIEPPSGGRDERGKARPRLLFWFRTPPSVKVGRVPFSDDVRKMIEAQNPGLRFDWPRIMSTPIPPADADHWRERRRAEKAARRAARDADAAEAQVAVDEAEAQPVAVAEEPTSDSADVAAIEEAIVGGPKDATEAAESDTSLADAQAVMAPPASDSQAGQPHEHRRRRRRRRGRRGRHGAPGAAEQQATGAQEEITPAQQDAATDSETPPSDEV